MSTRPVAVLLAPAGLVAAVAVALLALGVIHVPWASSPSADPGDPSRARLRVEYAVLPANDVAPGADDLPAVAEIIRHRLEAVGVTDISVEVTGPDRILVTVPSVTDGLVLRHLVLPGGRLDFVPLGEDQIAEGQVIDLRKYPPLFSGDQVASASVGNDQQGSATVDFRLRPQAAALFGDYTAAHIGEYFAITLDGRVLSAPVILSAIPDGDVQIEIAEFGRGPEAVRDLVAILQYGSFPWHLLEVGTEPVPTSAGGSG